MAKRERQSKTTAQVIDELCAQGRDVNPRTLDLVILVAVEIAREGREGRRIGTILVVGDHERVMKISHPLILDPLLGHPDSLKDIDDSNMRETVKELAQLDGGFVISDSGVVVSATRYFEVSSRGCRLPMGLGSRHMAGASVSQQTKAVAVVVSESSIVRLFDGGELYAEIVPEVWLLTRQGGHGQTLPDAVSTPLPSGQLTVIRKTR